jgi:predicted nucleic acid-binding protein
MSFGDYCYFMDNPLNIDLSVCDTKGTIEGFLDLFNNHNERSEDPSKICDWLINHEINVITNELFQNELIINYEKKLYGFLQIVKKHFEINEDIKLKIYEYIVFDNNQKIMI